MWFLWPKAQAATDGGRAAAEPGPWMAPAAAGHGWPAEAGRAAAGGASGAERRAQAWMAGAAAQRSAGHGWPKKKREPWMATTARPVTLPRLTRPNTAKRVAADWARGATARGSHASTLRQDGGTLAVATSESRSGFGSLTGLCGLLWPFLLFVLTEGLVFSPAGSSTTHWSVAQQLSRMASVSSRRRYYPFCTGSGQQFSSVH